MADLRSSTSIGGNLAWHSGNLKFDPQGNTVRYAGYKVYTELDKPTAAEINVYTKEESDGKYTIANAFGYVSKGGDTMTGKLTTLGNDIEIKGTSPRLTLTDTDSSNKVWTLINNNNQVYICENGTSTVRMAMSSSIVNFNASDFQLNAKTAIRSTDTWLRINDTLAFTSGIYLGSSLIRTDGSLQVGSTTTAGLYATSSVLNWKGSEVFSANSYTTLDARYVMTSGNQTIAGTKTFSSTITGSVSGNAGTASTLQTARTIAISGAVTGTATSFNGGSNITIAATGLNASNLSTGTVPDARISGSYTGMTNLTGSGTVDFAKFLGNASDTVSAPSFSWTGDTNTGIYQPAADQLAITTGGVQRALFTSSGLDIPQGRVGLGTVAQIQYNSNTDSIDFVFA